MCYSAIIKQKTRGFNIPIDVRDDGKFWDEFFIQQKTDPKKYQVAAEDGRIFPYYYAPVLVNLENCYQYLPMRYQLFPSSPMYKDDPKHLSLFNARRDTLTKPNGLWGPLLEHNRGIVVLESFFEWVEVKDLVRAGVVTLDEIKNRFETIEVAKKKMALSIGKPYKKTKTASLPAIERKIEICFRPETTETILAPVIWDCRTLENGYSLFSFALLTDDPPIEVRQAGHDRCPIFLSDEAALNWLDPKNTDTRQLIASLDQRQTVKYVHRLAA